MKAKSLKSLISLCKYSLLTMLFLLFASTFVKAVTSINPPVMQWATHLDCTNGYTNSKDWIFKLRHTKDGGYVAVGYSNGGGGNVPSIYRYDQNGNVKWQYTYYFAGTDYGQFNDVVEDANGSIAAFGALGTAAGGRAFLVITDPFGAIQNSSTALLPCIGGFNNDGGNGIAVTPDGQFALTITSRVAISPDIYGAFIAVTDGFHSTLPYFWQYPSVYNLSDFFNAVSIGNKTSTTNYDILACGGETNALITISGTPVCTTLVSSIDKSNSDVIIANVNYNSGTMISNANWPKSFAWSSNFSSHYPSCLDLGPYSIASGSHCSNGCPNYDQFSHFLTDFFANTQRDFGHDILLNNNGDIIVAAYTDLIWPDQGAYYSDIYGGVRDCTRPDVTENGPLTWSTYDEYKDANCWLMKLDYSTGNFAGSNPNPEYIVHMSGNDFRTEIAEDACGNIFLVGSEADNTFCPTSADLASQLAKKADILVCKVDPNFSRIWRKNFHSDGLNQNFDNSSNPYDYECGFGIVINSDNSVTVAGNNGENGDDAVLIKLSSDEQVNITWDINYPPPISGYQLWNSNKKVIGKVLIQSGGTLEIQACTIQFGETRELINYNVGTTALNDDQSGIVVEIGGMLILDDGVVLRGLAKDPSNYCSRNYMWDGVTVEGNPSDVQSWATQGVVLMSDNGTTIQDARCGVRLAKKAWTNPQLVEQTVNTTETWDRGYIRYDAGGKFGGGYIEASDGNFYNNRMDVEFAPYTYSTGNWSFFNNITFHSDNYMPDPDYINDDGTRQGTDRHVSAWDVHRVKFDDVKFSNDNPSLETDGLRGIGIASLDANYRVNGTTSTSSFTDLTFGINATGIQGNNASLIENTSFRSNIQGILFQGTDFCIVKNNYFYVPEISTFNFATGIYTLSATNFNIYGNEFWSNDVSSRSKNYAIVVNHAGAPYASVIKNITHDFRTASQYELKNNQMDIQCNVFNTSLTDWAIYGDLNQQGFCPTGPIRNDFSQNCQTLGITHIYNDLGTSSPFEYDFLFDPRQPDPACSYTIGTNLTLAGCIGTDDCPNLLPPQDKDDAKARMNTIEPQLVADPENDSLKFELTKNASSFTAFNLVADSTDSAKQTITEYLDNDPTVMIPLAMPDTTDSTSQSMLATSVTIEQDFADLYSIVNDLKNSNRDYYQFTSTEKSALQTIAQGSSSAAVKADQILHWLNGNLPLRKPIDPPFSSFRRAKPKDQEQTTSHLSCFPNPFSNQLTVKFDESTSFSNGLVELVNPVTGALIKEVKVDKNATKVILDCTDISNGVYIIRAFDSKNLIEQQKVVLIK